MFTGGAAQQREVLAQHAIARLVPQPRDQLGGASEIGEEHRDGAAGAASVCDRGRGRALLAGVAEGHRGAAHAHHVAVAQAPAALQPLAVDERAVARDAVVADQPVRAQRHRLGVHGGDAWVPGKAHIRIQAAPDRDRALAFEHVTALAVLAVAIEQRCHREEVWRIRARSGGAARQVPAPA